MHILADRSFKLALLSLAIIAGLQGKVHAAAGFDTSFLVGEAASVNWNSSDKKIAAGTYLFDVYINSTWRGKYKFIITDDNKMKISREAVPLIGITDADDILKQATAGQWVDVDLLLHGGQSSLSSGQLRVNLTIPQAFVTKFDARWLPPSQWDEGINGLYTTYNANYYHAWRSDGISDTDNLYLTLNSGLDLGGSHLVDKSVYRKTRANPNGYWTNNERYIERPFPSLHSVIRVGESYTGSDWFDSLRYKGILLKQEQKMYPDIYRTYMPVIYGVAKTNSVIRVYQSGSVIYQNSVPPGPFAIRDLMPTGSRGDLTVKVQNADGTVESFVVPFSTLSDMLRPGSSEWLFNAGQVDVRDVDSHPDFMQGSFSHGINNYLTLYAGGTLSEKYHSILGGVAFSVPYIGSLSLSVDDAKAELGDETTHAGQRYKISWSRYFPTRTNLTLATYYYDTQNYLSFYDTVKLNALFKKGYSASSYKRSKHTLSATLDQPLPDDWGKIALRGSYSTYWQSMQKTKQYSVTYSNSWRDISYSVAASRIHYEYDPNDDSSEYDEANYGIVKSDESRIDLSLTIPFSIFGRQASLSSNLYAANGRYSSSTVGINGATQTVGYSASFSDSQSSASRSASLYADWQSPWSKLTASYTDASSYRQMGASASGTLMLWRGGLLASGDTGNTFVILDAPGAAGAIVNNNPGVQTNSRGQALIASASAYRRNKFIMDDKNSSNKGQAEILGNVAYAAPWYGSISYLKYQTDRRQVFTFDAELNNGEPLPFGASILNKQKEDTGYVAQGSQLYVKSEALPEILYVRYTDSSSKKERLCAISHPVEEHRNECTPAQ
ncbi:fimbrial biogenesis outer membrane usher protein [Gibbsiella dentisursi]|uniref:Fimbrial biogenesis outer membrane usher protein n=1 Tax=Gibbsiella dentisursi TaxID=796890 RepID=A0ABP7M1F0_9GAMM